MKKYDLVIFDLIDTLAYCEGFSDYSTKLEKSLGKGIVDKFVDGGTIDKIGSVEEAILKFNSIIQLKPDQEASVRRWLSWGQSRLFADAIEILEYLKKEGYMIGIISNSPPTTQDQLVDLGIKEYINEAIFSYEVESRKPEKEIFLKLLEKAQVAPSRALMIGDSIKNDINGARAVGINALLLDRNNTIDFDPKITNLSQLKDFLTI